MMRHFAYSSKTKSTGCRPLSHIIASKPMCPNFTDDIYKLFQLPLPFAVARAHTAGQSNNKSKVILYTKLLLMFVEPQIDRF